MSKGLSEQMLSRLSETIASQAGLYFPRERWPDLERGIRSAAGKFGYPDIESCARWLLSAPLTKQGIEILAGELTIGETYFFREKRSLEILSNQIIPEIARKRHGTDRRLRIWSAGCCTGEEPYTLAILLDRILPDLREWNVTILGTDVNPRFLKKASAGIFSEWSFRDSPPWLKENYFTPVGKNRFEIIPRIRNRVTFAYLNLAEDVYPCLTTNTNAMDLIFCCNVMMYFTPAGVKKVVNKFNRALINNGWFFVSPSETSLELFSGFSTVHFQGVILYRKGEKSSLGSPVPLPLEESVISYEANEPLLSPPVVDLELPPLTPVLSLLQKDDLPTAEVPSDPYKEALALFEQSNYLGAAEKLQANSAVLERTESLALLARICANLGDLAEARSWAEKAIASDKLNAELHYLRAIILQEQGVDEEAITALKRALYLDPDFVLAHFALGNFHLRQGNFKEADRHFTNVLKLLADYQFDDVLPQSDGLVAGRLKEMVESAMAMEKSA